SSFLLLSFSIILSYLIVDLKLCNRTGRGMVRYFIHLDNPEKYPYSRDDIVGHCGADVESYFELNKTSKITVMKEIVTYIYDNEIDNYADFLMICIQHSDDWFDVAINHNTLAINKMIDGMWLKKKKSY
ncbi:Rep family protein, partial [Aerococcus urinaeequi]|uniref:Rep family protein n=1 Tax=Aerococcus urinaeequi TaxID=51665 RepID=UPI003AAACDE2